MLFNALQTLVSLVAHAQEESALEMETQQMMILELLQPLQTVVTAADLEVAMPVDSVEVATVWAQPEEVAWAVVLEATAMVAAADVVEDPEAAAMEEVQAVVATAVAVAAVATVVAATEVEVSPKTSIHAADNLNQSRRSIDYLNSHCLLRTTQGDQAYKTV